MALWQGRSHTRPSGGRFRPHRSKRPFETGAERQETTIGPHRQKFARTRGCNQKIRLLKAETANVINSQTKTTVNTPVLEVLENAANPHYVRRNIITKGAVIKTELGPARVTSRPGQHGIINAILLER